MILSIFSIGFAQTSINIMTKDFMYRHKKIFGWNEAELGVLKSELDYWGSLNKN